MKQDNLSPPLSAAAIFKALLGDAAMNVEGLDVKKLKPTIQFVDAARQRIEVLTKSHRQLDDQEVSVNNKRS